MKSVIAAGLLATLASAPIASAEAAVIYSFAGVAQPGSAAPVPLNIRLELTSAGRFLLGGQSDGRSNPALTGNADRFVSLTVGSDSASPTFLRGSFFINLIFDSLGAVDYSALSFDGDSYDARIQGSNSSMASGTVGLAASPCSVWVGNCSVSGSWTMTTTPTPVPEPMSIALFGAGLAGLAMVRRRKA